MNIDCSTFYSSEQLGACVGIHYPWVGGIILAIIGFFFVIWLLYWIKHNML